jgi:hypothetical protein
MSNYKDLNKTQLTELALERGVPLTGEETKAKLIEMLSGEAVQEADVADAPSPTPVAPTVQTPVKEKTEVATLEDGDTLPWVIMDQAFYKEYFAKEKRIRILIPLAPGEKKGTLEVISINGYRIHVKKGYFVDVPESFATVIQQALFIDVDETYNLENATDETLQNLT